MAQHFSNQQLKIYYGDAKDALSVEQTESFATKKEFLSVPAYARLVADEKLNQLLFLDQTHGTQGLLISTQHQAGALMPFAVEGDYLVTAMPGVGIGVVTADCVPVVLYDARQRVVAVIHAGWRGAVAHIIDAALDTMQQQYGSRVANMRVFFGPSAGPCCYQVRDDVVRCIEVTYRDHVLSEKNNATFFDVARLIRLHCLARGISENEFDTSARVCTVCSPVHCSYRRDGVCAGRQMTVAWLV